MSFARAQSGNNLETVSKGLKFIGVETGGICPPFEREMLADEEAKVVFRDEHGVIKQDKKDGTTMPQFLEYPVRDRKTWENFQYFVWRWKEITGKAD